MAVEIAVVVLGIVALVELAVTTVEVVFIDDVRVVSVDSEVVMEGCVV